MNRGIFFLLLVIILGHKVFFLLPWARLEGSFNIRDVGLLMVWVGVGWLLFSGVRGQVLKNQVTWLVLSYVFLVAVHVSLARFYYDQPIMHGLIAARNQFTYLSFFLFLILLDSPEKIMRFLDYLVIVASAVLFLSVVNYFFPVVFHNVQYDEDWQVIRSGIRRAYVPAGGLISVAAIWAWTRWVRADKDRVIHGLLALFLIAGHFFQQSRGPIIGLVIAILAISYLARRAKELRYLLLAGVLGGILTTIFLPANLLLAPFVTAVEDVSQGTGTVKGRMEQLDHDIEEFMAHPYIGSGLVVIRKSEYSGLDASSIAAKTRKADLGYSHWVKMYGLSGIVWLGILFMYLGSTSLKVLLRSVGPQYSIALFACGLFASIVVTGVTISHFLVPERILLFMLLAAIVVRISIFRPAETDLESESEMGPSLPRGSDNLIRRPLQILRRR